MSIYSTFVVFIEGMFPLSTSKTEMSSSGTAWVLKSLILRLEKHYPVSNNLKENLKNNGLVVHCSASQFYSAAADSQQSSV